MMATWVAGMGFSQAHRNRSTLDDVPDLVRVLVLKGLRMNNKLRIPFQYITRLLTGRGPIRSMTAEDLEFHRHNLCLRCDED